MSEASLPLIGLTCDSLRSAESARPFHGIRPDYVQAIAAAQGAPLIIPTGPIGPWLDRCYTAVDGLLLTGGDDVAPLLYGEEPHPKLGVVDSPRDLLEIHLIKRALADAKPILAICRGIQILNVALGGTLYQDLPSQLDGVHEHKQAAGGHEVYLDGGCRLSQIIGAEVYCANSFHHQAVKVCAAALKATGKTGDGVIEAVEGRGESFIIGLQCHPERMLGIENPAAMATRRIFEAFIQAAEDYSVSSAES